MTWPYPSTWPAACQAEVTLCYMPIRSYSLLHAKLKLLSVTCQSEVTLCYMPIRSYSLLANMHTSDQQGTSSCRTQTRIALEMASSSCATLPQAMHSWMRASLCLSRLKSPSATPLRAGGQAGGRAGVCAGGCVHTRARMHTCTERWERFGNDAYVSEQWDQGAFARAVICCSFV